MITGSVAIVGKSFGTTVQLHTNTSQKLPVCSLLNAENIKSRDTLTVTSRCSGNCESSASAFLHVKLLCLYKRNAPQTITFISKSNSVHNLVYSNLGSSKWLLAEE